MSSQWKHRKAEEQVEPLLRPAARLDGTLLTTYPRAIKDILCAWLPVAFESHRGLKVSTVCEVLGDVYGVDHDEILDEGDTALAGYTFARGELAVVFSDPQYGDGFERFTIAHEASHLVVEYLPALKRAGQPDLFGTTREPVLFARRDPPGHMFGDRLPNSVGASELSSQYERLRTDRSALTREIVANACAAELLAPHREVRTFLRTLGATVDRVHAVQVRFGLSRRAAQVRLADLGLASDSPAQPSFLLE